MLSPVLSRSAHLPVLPPAFSLTVREMGGGRGEVIYSFTQSVVCIGRSRESDVPLVNRCMAVSRCHAEIRRVGDRFVRVDVGSKNATWLNGLRLTPFQPYPLRCGDRFQAGDFIIVFRRLGTSPALGLGRRGNEV